MAAPTSLLEEALDAWRAARQGVIDELKNLPADKLGFRPTPDTFTVRELAQHVLEAAMVVAGELARADADLARAPVAKLARTHAAAARRAKTKARLLALLASQMRDAERKLRAAGELSLLQIATWFDGRRRTRLAFVQQTISHEQYHRGQIALYARLMGLAPALTQAIRAQEEQREKQKEEA